MVRCIHAACGHALPRRVNFCPYCGTAQGETRQGGGIVLDRPPRGQAAAAATLATGAAAASRVDAPAAVPEVQVATPAAAVQPAEPPPAPTPAPPAQRVPPPPVTPPRPPPAAPRAEAAAGAPPKREPVRLRWWLLALAALWAIWLIAKPSNRRIEAQMDKAIALATECKPREAQTELIALRGTKATAEQLQRVQKALNEASATCTRKRQRDKAWREAKGGVDAALAGSAVERARTRLRAFTRRWGEDEATRATKETIDARQPEHRRADGVEGEMTR
jgi:hypothetical protein